MAIIALTSTAQAGYRIVIPMEQSKGGPLPNGSISITPKTPSLPVENWQPAEPIYSEWVNVGDVSGCSNWTPDASTMLKDETFNQTATDCQQTQSRTRQDREQETTTLAYRNVGEPVTIGQNITINSSRTATGTASCSYSRYVTGTPDTYWFAGTSSSNDAYLVHVNGVQIKAANGYYTNSFTLNGTTYKRGSTIRTSITSENGTYRYYDVCK
ncbi:hypothetical protein [Pseudomonas monteilii]|uniref:hypothetical protein n=1 Tax=Pseudomonas monteilii TaxID=76759 RepID=UPI000F739F1A|nr:hypothetical protein [Pseudomonas monteilii]